jgi:hypothetical protein
LSRFVTVVDEVGDKMGKVFRGRNGIGQKLRSLKGNIVS